MASLRSNNIAFSSGGVELVLEQHWGLSLAPSPRWVCEGESTHRYREEKRISYMIYKIRRR